MHVPPVVWYHYQSQSSAPGDGSSITTVILPWSSRLYNSRVRRWLLQWWRGAAFHRYTVKRPGLMPYTISLTMFGGFPCLAHLRGHLVRSRQHGWFLLLVTCVHRGQPYRVSFFLLASAQVSDCKLHQSEEDISAPIPVRCAGWNRQMNQSTQKMGRF
jgi:hypothetical protein